MLGLSQPHAVSAQLYPSYLSGITVVNLSNVAAQFSITYIRGGTGADAGQKIEGAFTPIDPEGVVDFAAIPIDNFQGAVIISSDQPMGAISTITGGGMARGSYLGATSGSKEVRLPSLYKNHGSSQWSSYFAVQNIGATDTVVNVDYAQCSGAVNDTKTVKPGSMVIFNQATTACLPNGTASAVVTSTVEDILVVADQESTKQNAALVSTGFTGAGSPSFVIPLVNENNPAGTGGKWRTAILVMNNGAVSTNLKLTYKRTDGTTCTEQMTIPASQTKIFAGNNFIVGNSGDFELVNHLRAWFKDCWRRIRGCCRG